MNIEIKDFEEETYQQQRESRKIKFKQSSFSVIYNTFKDFIKRKLVNFADKKLEKAKQDLVNVEFKRGDNLVNYDGTTNKENILKKKTEAIDRWTKIINFLERGNYKRVPAPGEEDSRPLRLRKIMEDGLRKNVGSVEKIDENQKEEVMNQINDVVNDTKKTIEEETKILNNKIGDIKENLPEEENVEENFENITVEDVREQVEESFKNETNEATEISTEDVKDVVEDNFKNDQEQQVEEKVEEEKPITYEDVSDLVNESFEPVEEDVKDITPITNIEKREIGAIKGLETTNDDIFGKEEIKEEPVEEKEEAIREVPVVVPDRDEEELIKANEEFKEAEEVYNKIINETEDEKETTEKVKETDEKIYEEASEIPEDNKEEIKEEPVEEKEEKKEIPEEENIGFDFSDASINDIKKAAEISNSPKDLAAMMDKIRLLRKEEERINKEIEQAKEEEAAKEEKLQETYKMFDDYCNALEAKCNKDLEEKEAIINKSKEKDDVINKMLSAMEMTAENSTKKKK